MGLECAFFKEFQASKMPKFRVIILVNKNFFFEHIQVPKSVQFSKFGWNCNFDQFFVRIKSCLRSKLEHQNFPNLNFDKNFETLFKIDFTKNNIQLASWKESHQTNFTLYQPGLTTVDWQATAKFTWRISRTWICEKQEIRKFSPFSSIAEIRDYQIPSFFCQSVAIFYTFWRKLKKSSSFRFF